jgi:Trk-type K+ transport system membrane component
MREIIRFVLAIFFPLMACGIVVNLSTYPEVVVLLGFILGALWWICIKYVERIYSEV